MQKRKDEKTKKTKKRFEEEVIVREKVTFSFLYFEKVTFSVRKEKNVCVPAGMRTMGVKYWVYDREQRGGERE